MTMTMTDSWLDRRPAAPPRMAPEEWALRCQLADCYNLFHFLGWSESIFNHITMRVPGPEHHYLLNPFGLLYEEVTPDNLEELVEHLDTFTLDINEHNTKVRLFCE